jgi:RNA polymerase sigma factor (sigma-70 family)
MHTVVPYPRNADSGDDAERLSDHDLLDRFVRNRDEAAFAAVVQRHGAMVLGVCGRVLRNAAEAEDAFQATFLALVRKAQTIRKKASLASWLYGVAYHIAMNARRGLARRASREADLAERHARRSAGEASWREVQLVLDEELKQLPERFRIPLVLCYLEGKTRDEAAQEIGWSLGTFRGRLDCGRELLRARLIRRGLTLSTALFAGALTQSTASAAVPPVLAGATVKAGMLYATGNVAHECGIPPHIVALTRTTLQWTLAGKLKVAATAILGLSLVSTGTVLVVTRERDAGQPPEPAETVLPATVPNRAVVDAAVPAPNPVPVAPAITDAQRGRTYVDLQPYANQRLTDSFHFDGNNLANLPTGEQRLAGVNFKIESRLIQLSCGGAADMPQKVEGIKLGARVSRISILHATHFYADEDQVIGHYTVNYVDRTREVIPIVYGKDLCNWWWTEGFAVPSRAEIGWEGTNAYLANTANPKIRLYVITWQNPKPSRKVASLDFSSTNTAAAPFCVAITAEK